MSGFDSRVHTDLNLIEVRPAGVVKIVDVMSYAQEMLSRDIVIEGTIEYYDLSEVTDLSANFKSARTVTGLLREWLSRGWHGSVFFTPRREQFEMIRMFGAIAENIEGAPGLVLIPRREPTSLAHVRDLIARYRQNW